MEMTCNRCHQTVLSGVSFCPNCGLPQLVYSAEVSAADAGQPTRWNEAVRDASVVAWKPALRSALAIGIPAGILCAFLWPMGILGLMLMAVTGAWVVSLYARRQQPAWITLGAGARIGMVTGIVGGWTSMATIFVSIFAMRYWLQQGQVLDSFWSDLITQKMPQQWQAMGVDAHEIAQIQVMMLSPGGRAAWVLCAAAFVMAGSLLFAIAGGAFSARMMIRRRRPQG
jgi:hypothetical protein